MKTQVKALAIATLLAAGSANAAIENSNTGNGELFFSIWNTLSKVAYTFDTGIRMNDFVPGGTGTRAPTSFNLTSDSNWSTFKAAAPDATKNVWMIGAMDDTDSASTGGTRILTTSNGTATAIGNQLNAPMNDFPIVNSFLIWANASGTNLTQANGSSYTTLAAGADYFPGAGGTVDLSRWGGNATFGATANSATALSFYLLTNSNGDDPTAKVNVKKFVDDTTIPLAQKWSINTTTNTLSFATGTIVEPVVATPIPAAAWLLGSALLGLVGVGRRQSKANIIAA